MRARLDRFSPPPAFRKKLTSSFRSAGKGAGESDDTREEQPSDLHNPAAGSVGRGAAMVSGPSTWPAMDHELIAVRKLIPVKTAWLKYGLLEQRRVFASQCESKRSWLPRFAVLTLDSVVLALPAPGGDAPEAGTGALVVIPLESITTLAFGGRTSHFSQLNDMKRDGQLPVTGEEETCENGGGRKGISVSMGFAVSSPEQAAAEGCMGGVDQEDWAQKRARAREEHDPGVLTIVSSLGRQVLLCVLVFVYVCACVCVCVCVRACACVRSRPPAMVPPAGTSYEQPIQPRQWAGAWLLRAPSKASIVRSSVGAGEAAEGRRGCGRG